jgi:hypothetical protein
MVSFTKPNGKIFWCNNILPMGYSDEDIGKLQCKIGSYSDIDDEQLDIMVSSFIMDFHLMLN